MLGDMLQRIVDTSQQSAGSQSGYNDTRTQTQTETRTGTHPQGGCGSSSSSTVTESERRRDDDVMAPPPTTNLPGTTTLHPFNRCRCLFFTTTGVSRYQKGKTSLDLNGINWHQLDHMQTICTSLHTNTLSLNCYRPDALPDLQRTVSEH